MFSRSSVTIPLTSNEEGAVIGSAEAVAEAASKHPEIFDPGISRAFRWLVEQVKSTGRRIGELVGGLLQSLKNFLAETGRVVADVYAKARPKLVKGLASDLTREVRRGVVWGVRGVFAAVLVGLPAAHFGFVGVVSRLLERLGL